MDILTLITTILAIVFGINIISFIIPDQNREFMGDKNCGFNKTYEFFIYLRNTPAFSEAIICAMTAYMFKFCWDLSTVFMYLYQIIIIKTMMTPSTEHNEYHHKSDTNRDEPGEVKEKENDEVLLAKSDEFQNLIQNGQEMVDPKYKSDKTMTNKMGKSEGP